MYIVQENRTFHEGESRYCDSTFFNNLEDAKEFAIRKAAKAKGAPEMVIFNMVDITRTSLPTEVSVSV